MGHGRGGPAIEVELWAAPVPLPRPVVTPAGTFDTYHHLVVRAIDPDGTTGWGLAAGVTADEVERCAGRARSLLEATGPGVAGLVAGEALEQGGSVTPPDRWSRWAACALATAGWDLRSRRAGVPCADLWGRPPGTEALPCYASGFFLSSPADALAEEADRCAAAGFATVKVRVGLALDEDLARLEVVRHRFPGPTDIAVDAVEAWSVEDALGFVAVAGPLLWVEDPVPNGELAALTARLPAQAPMIAAGESLTDLTELEALRVDAGVGAVLLDVQQVGGPQRFLRAAHRLSDLGARVGAHVFTPVSTHLLACVADPLPVEVFDWSDGLFRQPPAPDAAGHLPVAGPGLGVELDTAQLRHLGRLLHRERR